jgi:hypothetical protein
VTDTDTDTVRVWLVERTFSDDEQNVVITTYATPDGDRYYRRELAMTSLSDADDGTPVARDVSPDDLGEVDPEDREAYATAAREAAADHDPDDVI